MPENALAIIGLGMVPKKLRATVQAIVAAGLWEECEGGFRVPAEKWARWQTTREEVQAERAKRQERAKKGAEKRWGRCLGDASSMPQASTRNAQSHSSEPEPEPKPEPGSGARARMPEESPARPGEGEVLAGSARTQTQNGESAQRDEERPPTDGVDAREWRRACAIADAIEEAGAPQMRVVDAGGTKRAMAAAMLMERVSEGVHGAALRKMGMPAGGEAAWIELVVNELALRWRTDPRLGEIFADLRKWPDGLYPAREHAGIEGRKACRIEEAARIMKRMGVGLGARA